MRAKSGKNKFFRFYIGFVSVFALLIIVGLFVFHSFLEAYEMSQPKSLAQKICDEYIKPADISALRDKYSLKLSPYETGENAEKAFKNIISGDKLEVNYSSRTPKGSDICFYVKSGDKNIIRIALSKSKEKGSFGLVGYNVDEISLLDDVYKTANITFPSNADITVNGRKLSKDDIKESKLPEIKDVEFGKGTVYTCTAHIENLLSNDLDISVPEKEFEVKKTGSDYSVSAVFDGELKEEIEEFAIAGAKAYAEYMQDNGSLGQLGKYVDTSSDFYKGIRGTIVRFALSFSGSSFDKLECTDLTQHSDEIYSCRVKFTHVMKQGAKVYHDDFDKRVYLRVKNNSKKIIDMQSN